MKRPLVIIESPYAGDVKKNVAYARDCMLDSIKRGEAPYASHLLLTQVLDDTNPDQREKGIEIGLQWGRHAKITAVYIDLGVTAGMRKGINRALKEKREIQVRKLYNNTIDEENLESHSLYAAKKNQKA